VLIVASVSCIYGLGSPAEYFAFVERITRGERLNRQKLARRLIEMQYERNDYDLARARFRVRGDTLEIMPAYEDVAVRVEFFGDDVERIVELDPLTGEILSERAQIDIYPAKHFVTSREKLEDAVVEIEQELDERLIGLREEGRVLEAQRLEHRTRYDLEMLRGRDTAQASRTTRNRSAGAHAAARRGRSWTTCRTTTCSSSTSPTWPSRSCAACSTERCLARTHSSTSASACRRRGTTVH